MQFMRLFCIDENDIYQYSNYSFQKALKLIHIFLPLGGLRGSHKQCDNES